METLKELAQVLEYCRTNVPRQVPSKSRYTAADAAAIEKEFEAFGLPDPGVSGSAQ